MMNICHEAQISEITEASATYASGVSHLKVGDWVTFRKNGYRRGEGAPHRIVELREDAESDFEHAKGPDAMTFGARYNVRVMEYTQGVTLCYWCEAWELTPYKGT